MFTVLTLVFLFQFSSAAPTLQVLFDDKSGIYQPGSTPTSTFKIFTIPPEAFPTRSPSLPSATPPLVMSYYPDWTSFPPENIDFKRFDWIDFAFAVPKVDLSISWDDKHAPDALERLVQVAHSAGKKVKLSIGGWSGSGQFSNAVAKPENRQTLAENILDVYTQYQVDGIDIDWEYPGQVGQSGNKATPEDSLNFLAFLQLLRKKLPKGAKITAAVQSQLFAPLSDVSAFAKVLDWVMLMNYDVWGCTFFLNSTLPRSMTHTYILSVYYSGTERASR